MQIKDFDQRFNSYTPGMQWAPASYAVLVPLVSVRRKPHLLFEVRSESLGCQPGEVCFPGGRMEPGETVLSAALRETREELSIPESEIRPIAELDFLPHASGSLIHPVLAEISKKGLSQLKASPSEVKETFLVPFSFFQEEKPLQYSYDLIPSVSEDFPYHLIGLKGTYPWKGSHTTVPIYQYDGHPIWGLTGRICMHLAEQMEQKSPEKRTAYQHIEHPFPPLFRADSRVLILGSFPSVKSREGMFFYNHPQNRFWKVIAAIVGEAPPKTIPEKQEMLLRHHIALWDVIHSCDIVGSSDSSIKNAVPNDLLPILKGAKIEKIYTNGAASSKLYKKYLEPVLERPSVPLPSTSPANASFSLEKLIEIWGSALPENL